MTFLMLLYGSFNSILPLSLQPGRLSCRISPAGARFCFALQSNDSDCQALQQLSVPKRPAEWEGCARYKQAVCTARVVEHDDNLRKLAFDLTLALSSWLWLPTSRFWVPDWKLAFRY